MRLIRAEVEGYRSIRQTLELHFDRQVTVLLGANDHGKSNLLAALTHLNMESPFAEQDLNWDDAKEGRSADRPRVSAVFELTQAERAELRTLEEADRASKEPAQVEGDVAAEAPQQKGGTRLHAKALPTELTIIRVGVSGKLAAAEPEAISSAALETFLSKYLPRIELIELSKDLGDSVTHTSLEDGSNEFMRGIFYYAGLEQKRWEPVFRQDTQTERELDQASVTLNGRLTTNWAQGKELTFLLRHDSAAQEIGLRIEDPAVKGRYVHASQRSAGFTHFFKLKTVLHARQVESQAQSYVWLFDEPGVTLHPDGQRDLLKALERIARANQVAYCTHSIFLINNNYPTRHRLLVKDEKGTRVDGKPYLGNWRRAIEALGLALPGTILFASHVLLTEGDSDPIYIPAVLQKLAEWGYFSGDLNSVSVMGTGDARHADAMVRWLTETTVNPQVAYLGDGDSGGLERLKDLEKLFKDFGVPSQALRDGMSVEDFLPGLDELWLPAVAAYAAKVGSTSPSAKKPRDASAILAALRTSFAATFPSGETANVSDWAVEASSTLIGLSEKLSKVGIAREYVDALREYRPDPAPLKKNLKLPLELATAVSRLLPLPSREAAEGAILDDVQAPSKGAL